MEVRRQKKTRTRKRRGSLLDDLLNLPKLLQIQKNLDFLGFGEVSINKDLVVLIPKETTLFPLQENSFLKDVFPKSICFFFTDKTNGSFCYEVSVNEKYSGVPRILNVFRSTTITSNCIILNNDKNNCFKFARLPNGDWIVNRTRLSKKGSRDQIVATGEVPLHKRDKRLRPTVVEIKSKIKENVKVEEEFENNKLKRRSEGNLSDIWQLDFDDNDEKDSFVTHMKHGMIFGMLEVYDFEDREEESVYTCAKDFSDDEEEEIKVKKEKELKEKEEEPIISYKKPKKTPSGSFIITKQFWEKQEKEIANKIAKTKKKKEERKKKKRQQKESEERKLQMEKEGYVTFKIKRDTLTMKRITAQKIPFLRPFMNPNFKNVQDKKGNYVVDPSLHSMVTMDSLKIAAKYVEKKADLASLIFEECLIESPLFVSHNKKFFYHQSKEVLEKDQKSGEPITQHWSNFLYLSRNLIFFNWKNNPKKPGFYVFKKYKILGFDEISLIRDNQEFIITSLGKDSIKISTGDQEIIFSPLVYSNDYYKQV